MRQFTLTGLILLFFACGPAYDESELLGTWRAASVVEEGRPLQINPAAVQFEFMPDGKYRYRSTLNYQESGAYHLEQNLLVTRDTTSTAGLPKRVRILELTEDSLYLGMNEAGKARKMYLYRTK